MAGFDQVEFLIAGINTLGLSVSQAQIDKLMAYKNLLLKWNKVYNLTALTEPQTMLTHNLLDGLAVTPYFQGLTAILDVGSGMGVPGIILAIMCPESEVTVIDSNSKKTAFLLQVKIELKLNNLIVVASRVENYCPHNLFSCITSRAFANLTLFIKLTEHLLTSDGIYLAMKSEQGLQELATLKVWESQVISLLVPNLGAQRFLIKMSRK